MNSILSGILSSLLASTAVEALQKFISEAVDPEWAVNFIQNLCYESVAALVSSGEDRERHAQNLSHLKVTAMSKLAQIQIKITTTHAQSVVSDALRAEIESALDELTNKIIVAE